MSEQTISRFMNGDKVKVWPAKQQVRLVVLEYFSSKFEFNKIYTEKEVNKIINQYQTFGDHATIRRDLYENGFLDRDNYGTSYWKKKQEEL